MNVYLLCIVGFICLHYLLGLVDSLLNLRALAPLLPPEFAGVYDQEEYRRSQVYTRVSTSLSLVQSSTVTGLTLVFILVGGFNQVDLLARSLGLSALPTGLIFIALLALLSFVVNLPFSLYSTFVLEERFGFNTTTWKTYLLDLVKTALLAVLLGGPLLGFILWFFAVSGPLGWLYCWLAVMVFVVVVQGLAPVVIMPLFNTFTPLEEGALKEAVTTYARGQQFALQGIYTMDGSKRSTRLNAFFTGFGRFRRIVFFDTLVEKLSVAELVAILGHEMGHYRERHLLKMMVLSMAQTGVMFYLLSLFLGNEQLFAAFQMEHISVHGGLVFFGFLYAPISTLLSIGLHAVSRHHEYAADAYAVSSTGERGSMIRGLKKLSVTNLSNLTPHPFHVVLNYSHPPVLARIRALEQLELSEQETSGEERA
ncbi:M48 family metallopeptidase [Desulfogranum mediterraneum]|uniref:M48 family metallopeptidase n=1 Tax=Desulfogranum mediterraneum TaxID=160661 RepID=UPI000420ABE2|nr:M48 family metallopeptidase [Desulfogranum mediterraneum]